MPDRITKEQRQRNMSHVKSKDTSIERKVRSALFRHGFRFRKNVKSLPGTPDIVLPKYKTVIFVNGCFWHRHAGCQRATLPETRRAFWERKLNANVVNDKLHKDALYRAGWHVITVWQCELEADFSNVLKRIEHILLQQCAKCK